MLPFFVLLVLIIFVFIKGWVSSIWGIMNFVLIIISIILEYTSETKKPKTIFKMFRKVPKEITLLFLPVTILIISIISSNLELNQQNENIFNLAKSLITDPEVHQYCNDSFTDANHGLCKKIKKRINNDDTFREVCGADGELILSYCYLQKNEFNKALSTLENAQKKYPNDFQIPLYLYQYSNVILISKYEDYGIFAGVTLHGIDRRQITREEIKEIDDILDKKIKYLDSMIEQVKKGNTNVRRDLHLFFSNVEYNNNTLWMFLDARNNVISKKGDFHEKLCMVTFPETVDLQAIYSIPDEDIFKTIVFSEKDCLMVRFLEMGCK